MVWLRLQTPPRQAWRKRPAWRPAVLVLFQMLADKLGHLEHVDLGLAAKHGLQRVVRLDHAFVLLVLQAVLLDVGPELLGDLGAWERLGANNFSQRGAWRNRPHERGVRSAAATFFRALL